MEFLPLRARLCHNHYRWGQVASTSGVDDPDTTPVFALWEVQEEPRRRVGERNHPADMNPFPQRRWSEDFVTDHVQGKQGTQQMDPASPSRPGLKANK